MAEASDTRYSDYMTRTLQAVMTGEHAHRLLNAPRQWGYDVLHTEDDAVIDDRVSRALELFDGDERLTVCFLLGLLGLAEERAVVEINVIAKEGGAPLTSGPRPTGGNPAPERAARRDTTQAVDGAVEDTPE